jgi:nucleoid-associated protein YgaU
LHGEFEVINESPSKTEQLAVALNEAAMSPAGVPIPPSESALPPARKPESCTPALVDTYMIAAGESLSSIAERLYQDARQWRSIAKANPGLNPRRLRPCHVIKLPRPVPMIIQRTILD